MLRAACFGDTYFFYRNIYSCVSLRYCFQMCIFCINNIFCAERNELRNNIVNWSCASIFPLVLI